MIVLLFFAVTFTAVNASLNFIVRNHPLMDCTKFISEEHFTPGRTLVVVLPPAEQDSTKEEVGYLIEQLHKSSRWPILVFNVTYEMNSLMRIEINPHGSYIILVSGYCRGYSETITDLLEQLAALALRTLWHSWNPRAKFVVPVMDTCRAYNESYLSRAILSILWLYKVTKGVVLFSESNERVSTVLQEHMNSSSQDAQWSLHTWLPYENSQRCDPLEGTVPLRTLLARNLSDVRNSGIFHVNVGKNFNRCRVTALLRQLYPYLLVEHRIWNNVSYIHYYGLEEIILSSILQSLNLTFTVLLAHDLVSDNVTRFVTADELSVALANGLPEFIIGGIFRHNIHTYNMEVTHSYYRDRLTWCTPCAIRRPRWSSIFRIFSTDLWISFILSLVVAVITVICISSYGLKLYLPELTVYRNTGSITANIVSVALGVSVATQPRTTRLRVFFMSWVCYSVAISTVFQAYLTTFLIDTGYEEPIKTIDQMLNSTMKFGFASAHKGFFNNSTDPVGRSILKGMVTCPDAASCIKWALTYHNISTLRSDMLKDIWDSYGIATDENNKPFLCDLEDGDVVYVDMVMAVVKGSPLLEHINDIIDRIVEAGLFMYSANVYFTLERIISKTSFSDTLADTYLDINIGHVQSAFYLLLLGHALALISLFVEIIWFRHVKTKSVSSEALQRRGAYNRIHI